MRTAPSVLIALSLAASTPAASFAQSSDPAGQKIEAFDQTLLSSWRDAKSLGVQGRVHRLEPVVRATFDLSAMVRFAVGPGWEMLSPADQTALLNAFTRFTVASWAHNFSDYSGQKLVVSGVDTSGKNKLVHVQIKNPKGEAITLIYRMRESASGGGWKIIDVYFNGSISQLASQRADYTSTLASGGPQALVKKINDLSDKLMTGA